MTEDVWGPMPVRLDVQPDQVRRLIATQFPQWAGLPVRPVATPGWDNRSFRLGDDMLVRLPSHESYARAVAKEQRWLPALAPHLPLPIPRPLAHGSPGEDYPFHWSVLRWLDGEPAHGSAIGDLTTFAADLAGFLRALRQVDPAGGPEPGIHNWFRGGPLTVFEVRLQHGLGDREAPPAVTAIWQDALATTWDGPPVWFHGDVYPGNLLLRGGRLSAVIDFGSCGVGDPACDLAVAWTMLDGPSREVFRDRLGVDDAMWSRGRGWALWKAVADGDTTTLDRIVADHRG
jgi:aminoglycoside phosphotransferase (APT) family kinase protein